jgi:hypothetical protein
VQPRDCDECPVLKAGNVDAQLRSVAVNIVLEEQGLALCIGYHTHVARDILKDFEFAPSSGKA